MRGFRSSLNIADSNWPALLPEINGTLPGPALSDDDIADFRKAGVSFFLTTDSGRVVAPAGGGYATAKNSMSAQRREAFLRQTARAWQKTVVADKPRLLKLLTDKGNALPANPVFTFWVGDDGKAFVFVEGIDCRINLGDFNGSGQPGSPDSPAS